MDDSGGTPAWLICEDLLTKAKDELILEAIDILHDQINQKRIDIKGYVAVLPEKDGEMERDLFIINKLLERGHEIRSKFNNSIEEKGSTRNAETLLRSEELKKFLLAVDGITVLMDMSRLFREWAEETGRYTNIKDPKEVLRKSISNDERTEALKFVLNNRKFKENNALSKEEYLLLRSAL